MPCAPGRDSCTAAAHSTPTGSSSRAASASGVRLWRKPRRRFNANQRSRGFMDLTLSETQEMFKKVAADFVKAEVPSHQMTQWYRLKETFRPELYRIGRASCRERV